MIPLNSTPHYIPIAVVGMGCRFPAGANSPEKFWQLLMSGKDAVGDVPAGRWNQEYFHSDDRSKRGSMVAPQGGFIDDIDGFDNSFFNFSTLEAANMDPQQRLLLQVSWEALEQGTVPCSDWAGKDVGVFMGCFTMDYHLMQFLDPLELGAFASTGIMNSMLANRISYAYDFKGPSMSVDTACSGSLTALHLACNSLQRGESAMAIAGGSMLMLLPDYHIAESKTGFLSKDGRCKSFSAEANGYVRSEGVGVVVLKKLEDAIAAGDHIQGVIIGSAINQDGRTTGITMPNPLSQMAVMRSALKVASIHPSEVSYVEAHGTGTPTGDPAEAASIGRVYRLEADCENPLWIGSCKSNIGHTESAAGIAGLIKTILCLQHRKIPPNLHADPASKLIPFNTLRLKIPRQSQKLFPHADNLIAGVNSFGFGGANAHVLVKAFETKKAKIRDAGKAVYIFTLSAQSERALKTQARHYVNFLHENKTVSLADCCYNVCVRRSQLQKRKAFVVKTKVELTDMLKSFAELPESDNVKLPYAKKMVWVFSGLGRLTYGMSNQFFERESVFRKTYLHCDKLYSRIAGYSLLKKLASHNPEKFITDTKLSHPAQFFHQVSLAAYWRSIGIVPDTILGYSSGEFAAFYEAGVYTLEETLKLIFKRVTFLDHLQGSAAMLSVNAGEKEMLPFIEKYNGDISIAAFNSHLNITVSGKRNFMEQLAKLLTKENISYSLLDETVPHHHQQMLESLALKEMSTEMPAPKTPTVSLYSTITGSEMYKDSIDKDYWFRNLCNPVQFLKTIEKITTGRKIHFLELSGRQVLLPFICSNSNPQNAITLNPVKKLAGIDYELQTLANIFESGFTINWKSFYPKGNWIDLPSYPWQNVKLWQEPVKSRNRRLRVIDGLFLGAPSDDQPDQWESLIDMRKMPWLADHRIMDECILPGAVYINMVLTALQKKHPELHFAIEKINFLKPVILQKQSAFFIRFALDENNNSFLISATRALWPREFEEVAEGHFRQMPPGMTGSIDLHDYDSHNKDFIASDEIYQIFSEANFKYGPSLRGLGKLFRTESGYVCELSVPKEFCISQPGFHPIALDMVFQCLLTVKYNGKIKKPFFEMPTGIDQLRIFKPPSEKMFAIVELTEETEYSTRADLLLYDVNGSPVAFIKGFRTNRIQTNKARSGLITPSLSLPVWEEFIPTFKSGNSLIQRKRFLVLSVHQETTQQLVLQLHTSGHDVLTIPFHYLQQKKSSGSKLEPSTSLSEFIACLGAGDTIVNCCSLDALKYEDTIEYSLAPFICLSKAIRQTGFSGKVWSVTQSAQQIKGYKNDINIFQAGIWGIAKVFGYHEFSENHGGIIDIGASGDFAKVASIVSAETEREDQVAIRKGHCFCPRLDPMEHLSVQQKAPTFDEGGTYLITGALGAIGKEITEWMVRSGARNLLLTTSKKVVENNISRVNPAFNWIKVLREKGACIILEQVDFSDQKSIDSFVNNIDTRKIKGITCIAGFSSDQLIDNIDETILRKVLLVKAYSAYQLHLAFIKEPLEHFILFSSVGSLIPNRGMGSYAAANAFLDAIAIERKQAGLPALSLNWGPWSAGMVQNSGLEKVFSLMGINCMEASQAIAMLESVFYTNAPQVMIQATDWKKLLNSPLSYNRLLINYQRLNENTKINNYVTTENISVEGQLKKEIAEMIEIPENEMDTNLSLRNYEIDSISVMILRETIWQKWSVNITIDQLMAAENIGLLISKLVLASGSIHRDQAQ